MDAAVRAQFDLLNYPCVIKEQQVDTQCYECTVLINTNLLKISLEYCNNGQQPIIKLPEKLSSLQGDVDEYLSHNRKLTNEQIFVHVFQLAERYLVNERFELPPVHLYRRVLDEYYEFRNFYTYNNRIRLDMKKIEIVHIDAGQREHNLQINIRYDNETNGLYSIVDFELPVEMENEWNSLLELYHCYIGKIQELQEYFEVSSELATNCWLYEPQTAGTTNYKNASYRIVLAENVIALVTFDPLNMCSMPIIKILGVSKESKRLDDNVNSNIGEWNPSDCSEVLDSLQKLLGIDEFPKKPIEEERNDDVLLVNSNECCICFALEFDGKWPEIICPNSCCKRYFHTVCLYKWLCAINCSTLYNEISGACPNCDKLIRCPIP